MRTERGSDFHHVHRTLDSLRTAKQPERAHLLARVKENADHGSETDAFILRWCREDVPGTTRDLYALAAGAGTCD